LEEHDVTIFVSGGDFDDFWNAYKTNLTVSSGLSGFPPPTF
jgi:methyl coenzyme M reductase subunit C-like uncharacterized protein (methanogenesis marker protein 7)